MGADCFWETGVPPWWGLIMHLCPQRSYSLLQDRDVGFWAGFYHRYRILVKGNSYLWKFPGSPTLGL